jgi:hypothetical protein
MTAMAAAAAMGQLRVPQLTPGFSRRLKSQVAARKHGRAADHVATMVNALADALREKRELHVLTSDIQKASDEVPRAALWEALSLHGYITHPAGQAPPGLHRRHSQDAIWPGKHCSDNH